MTEAKRIMTMDDFEHRLLVGCINKARTEYMEEGKPTEDIDDLLIKAIDAPTKREKRKAERAGRDILPGEYYSLSVRFAPDRMARTSCCSCHRFGTSKPHHKSCGSIRQSVSYCMVRGQLKNCPRFAFKLWSLFGDLLLYSEKLPKA